MWGDLGRADFGLCPHALPHLSHSSWLSCSALLPMRYSPSHSIQPSALNCHILGSLLSWFSLLPQAGAG